MANINIDKNKFGTAEILNLISVDIDNDGEPDAIAVCNPDGSLINIESPPAPPQKTQIIIPINSTASPYYYISTNSTTYITIMRFIMPGSSEIGNPLKIEAVCGVSNVAVRGNIRIVNYLDSNIIIEKTDIFFPNTNYQIIDLESVLYFPTNTFIMEVQISKSGGQNNNYFNFSGLRFIFEK